ncbi:MAG: hypothetical protein QM539_10715 [Alphaproteobacteria bacterium]|nr:hypothetical protein [Alphaproteobacteria bacterium]
MTSHIAHRTSHIAHRTSRWLSIVYKGFIVSCFTLASCSKELYHNPNSSKITAQAPASLIANVKNWYASASQETIQNFPIDPRYKALTSDTTLIDNSNLTLKPNILWDNASLAPTEPNFQSIGFPIEIDSLQGEYLQLVSSVYNDTTIGLIIHTIPNKSWWANNKQNPDSLPFIEANNKIYKANGEYLGSFYLKNGQIYKPSTDTNVLKENNQNSLNKTNSSSNLMIYTKGGGSKGSKETEPPDVDPYLPGITQLPNHAVGNLPHRQYVIADLNIISLSNRSNLTINSPIHTLQNQFNKYFVLSLASYQEPDTGSNKAGRDAKDTIQKEVDPCDYIRNLDNNSQFKELFRVLNIAKNQKKETIMFYTSDGNHGYQEGEENVPIMKIKIPDGAKIDMFGHTHYDDEFSTFSIFSGADLVMLARLYKKGHINNPKTFVYQLATQFGTDYILMIEDIKLFQNFVSKIKNINDDDYFDNDYSDKGIKYSVPGYQEIGFLILLKQKKSGLRILKKNGTKWEKRGLDSNDVAITNPCN